MPKRMHVNMYQPSNFIPDGTKINSWDDLKPHFDVLINRKISNVINVTLRFYPLHPKD